MKNNIYPKISGICRAILAAVFLLCSAEASVPTGTVVWYKGENNLTDTKANTTAAAQGIMQYAAGRDGQAFKFNGATAVKIDNNPLGVANLNFGAGNFTIGVWVKFTATGAPRIIYQNGYALNSAVFIQIRANSYPRFFIRDGAGNAATVDGTAALNDGAWHYLTGVRSEKSALLYVDGVLQGCQTNKNLGNINASCNFHWLGGSSTISACAATAAEQFFNGSIDEFHIVLRDLPGSEIKNIYDTTP